MQLERHAKNLIRIEIHVLVNKLQELEWVLFSTLILTMQRTMDFHLIQSEKLGPPLTSQY